MARVNKQKLELFNQVFGVNYKPKHEYRILFIQTASGNNDLNDIMRDTNGITRNATNVTTVKKGVDAFMNQQGFTTAKAWVKEGGSHDSVYSKGKSRYRVIVYRV